MRDLDAIALSKQERLHNELISALFWITCSVENLSQLNRLAAPALGESFAVEIRASGYVAVDHLANRLGLLPANITLMGVRL